MAREARESQTGSKLCIQTETSKTTIQFVNVNLPLYRSEPINPDQYIFEFSTIPINKKIWITMG
jgi:hypothetical protein